jgi:hypothetical protein
MSRYLFLAGALPFLFLGTAHALHTPLRPHDRKGLAPADAAVGEAMGRTRLLLTGRTDMWKAWVGFNFSHSLGAVLFGVVVLLVGRSPASFEADASVFVPFAFCVSALYLVTGLRYWFRTPIAGVLIAVLLFAASWVLRLLS